MTFAIRTGWANHLGPGLLYAGAAVGVSHLVQSTRAGAEYGWWPAIAIVLIHIAKYPFFKAGTWYACHTGQSLIQGYKHLGSWAVVAFLFFTFSTMWAIIAAVTAVTAAIAGYVFGLSANAATSTTAVLLMCGALLSVGRFKWLEKSMRFIIIALTVSTVAAFAMAMLRGDSIHLATAAPVLHGASLIMLIKLMGWMPAPLDLSVWQSLWTLEKQQHTGSALALKKSLADFNLGYWGTMVLGVLFLGMGVATLYGTGTTLPEGGAAFSAVLLHMYTTQLGTWAWTIVAVAALATMLSTTLTCLDAIPRSLAETLKIYRGHARPADYTLALLLVAGGAWALLTLWNPGMISMVDLATVLSFVSTPAYAWLNLKTMQHGAGQYSMPLPGNYVWWSYSAIAILAALAVAYLWVVAYIDRG